ncbi:25847_t:CDS:2 [Gigaspora margarita]|uniref:25847_t:CDS:1 n=1 Tax=Gigaspora margarita TaxID=4874 RepID=A0ABM8W5H7_GIGMA|nr:25847_t:CDS:2 [Gigaspora margarita]
MSEDFSEFTHYPIKDSVKNTPLSRDIVVDYDVTRRDTLAKIDNAEFKFIHLRICIIAGAGFLTSAYHLFSINLVSAIFGYTYYMDNDNAVPVSIDTGLKSSATFGAILGQLLFGWMADRYGRKKMYGFELIIIIVAAVGSESPRFIMDVKGDIKKGYAEVQDLLHYGTYKRNKQFEKHYLVEPHKATLKDFREYFGRWKNGKILLATSFTWFAIDVGFYGIGFNQGIILNTINLNNASDPYQSLYNVAVGNIAVTALGTVPGYCPFFGLGDLLSYRNPHQYLPSSLQYQCEVFPTRYRCTGYGISAASGKLGAVVAQLFLLFLKDIGGKNHFISYLFQIFAAFAFAGFLCSYLIPETKGRSLEETSNENLLHKHIKFEEIS